MTMKEGQSLVMDRAARHAASVRTREGAGLVEGRGLDSLALLARVLSAPPSVVVEPGYRHGLLMALAERVSRAGSEVGHVA
jgi:hypothetical protein